MLKNIQITMTVFIKSFLIPKNSLTGRAIAVGVPSCFEIFFGRIYSEAVDGTGSTVV